MSCNTCERRSSLGCQVFKSKPENCWAYTEDKDWLKKVDEAIKVYKESRPVKD